MSISQFLPPDQLLIGLLSTDLTPCTCSDPVPPTDHIQISTDIENIQSCIVNLQQTLDAMNHEVVEVQGFLSQRDVLFHQLEHLRVERDEIEDQIMTCEIDVKKTVKIKNSRGLKEMNARLKRRIKQVEEYIDKMDSQNTKIESSIGSTYSMFTSQPRQYSQYQMRGNPNWVDRGSPTHYSHKINFNRDYVDVRRRLQLKQDEAWERVRRQEDQIEQRNARSLMGFSRTGTRNKFLSPRYKNTHAY